MRQLKQEPWLEVRDDDSNVVLMLDGSVVVFAGTPQGVFNANGRRVGDNYDDFKRLLGRPSEAGDARSKEAQKALNWFKRAHAELVRDPNAPPPFDPRAFLQANELSEPDTFKVASVEDAEEMAARVARCAIDARAQGAHPRFLQMLDQWERGWQALGRKFNRMGDFGVDATKAKGPSPAALAKRAAKRLKDQADRNRAKGKKGK